MLLTHISHVFARKLTWYLCLGHLIFTDYFKGLVGIINWF